MGERRRDRQGAYLAINHTGSSLGANLAQQEMRCMIDAVLDFLPPGASIRHDLIHRPRPETYSQIRRCWQWHGK